MKLFWKKYDLLIIPAVILIALDQWTKALIRQNIPFGESWSPWEWLAPYARLVHWNNTGVAFGMLQGYNLVFATLAVIVAAAVVYYYPRVPRTDWVLRLALGMQFAGAVGNLLDRIFFGHVTDFISVGDFAVFNVADASISVGVVVMLLGVWIHDKRERKEQALESASMADQNGLEEKPDGSNQESI